MPPRAIALSLIALAASFGAGCSDSDEQPTAATAPERSSIRNERCLVRVHGRSENGADPIDQGDYAELAPTGNDTYDGGFQWIYSTPEELASATASIGSWIDAVGCTEVILNGFSNGGAAVGALHCSGETFGDRVVGVVIDDPVPDDAVEGCDPADPDVPVTLYWTGGLTQATAGTSCADIGFTCSGEEIIGIDAYAEALGTSVTESTHESHQWYRQAPENFEWPDAEAG